MVLDLKPYETIATAITTQEDKGVRRYITFISTTVTIVILSFIHSLIVPYRFPLQSPRLA